jgi:anti-anti-sigma factor
MDEQVNVDITGGGEATVIAFKSASLSEPEAVAAVSRQINAFVEQSRPGRIIFDFGMVKFFSSQVLGLLLDIRAKLKEYEGEVLISGINPQLYRVFKITNLDKLFRFFTDKEAAVKALDCESAD